MNDTINTIDNYSTVVGTIGGVTGITTTNATTSGTTWVTPVGWDSGKEVSEGDVFKQIVSLLGIKIANVKIDDGTVIIYGYRRKKKYIIEINGRSIVVKNEKGDQISEILLSVQYPNETTINVPQQPYIVYPQPGTTSPNITWTQPYTTTTSGGDIYTISNIDNTTGTYTLDGNSTIIETNGAVNV